MPPRGKTAAAAPKLNAKTRICVLTGTEDALKRQYLQELQAALETAAGEVQVLTYEGASAELADVLDELRSYGLMQQHKIVIVDEADEFLVRHRAAVERYAENPVETATLVLRSNKWNAGKLDKLINKVGSIVKCSPLSPAEAANWLVGRARDEHGCKLDRKTADLLVQRLGVDLLRLDTELAKVALTAGPNKPITPAMIDELVGRASEEKVWGFQESILEALCAPPGQGRGPVGAALEKVHELVTVARQPDVLVAYVIADTIRKLYLGLLMKRQGVPANQITRELRLWGSGQRLFIAAMDRLDERTLGRLLDQIVAMDQRSKSGFGEALRNVECFCAGLADFRR